ncbi:MAG: hypothetical protein LBV30_01340 [Propionibacteriaceae bacterium]|jgi:ribonuclease HI|nr:hypothetical protein [Propionibacteriaceae bacterium]
MGGIVEVMGEIDPRPWAMTASITIHCLPGFPGVIVASQLAINGHRVWPPQLQPIPPTAAQTATINHVIDEFNRLYQMFRSAGLVGRIYVGQRLVRNELQSLACAFPWAELLDDRPQQGQPCVPPSDQEIRSLLPNGARLLVATDGSAGLHQRRGIGWACVTADGRRAWGNDPAQRSALIAELKAIDLATRKFSGSLQIHCDSRPAIAILKHPDSMPDSSQRAWICNLNQRITERDSIIVWVKGHNGHPLNTKADRIARVARLQLGGVYSAATANQIADRIASGD